MQKMTMTYENRTFDAERALYKITDAAILHCSFEGPADGESALKESSCLYVEDCDFKLRYPLWHVHEGKIVKSRMSTTCRAALWYDTSLSLIQCKINGIKAVRECRDIFFQSCEIESQEFGWFCENMNIIDSFLISEYPFLQSKKLEISNIRMKGKYSFQYVEDAIIRDSVLDTKDAFWHSRNVTVMDSVIKGEYLAWYSEGLKLIRCKIIGTQPMCYAKGLILEDCVMEDTDLSFENSDVKATIKGRILSVKNPISGRIEADKIGTVILDEHLLSESRCEIICRKEIYNNLEKT